MPIKKSELYSSLWKSCDELRGGMDASQYKDYVLVLLFVKYVSDKYANKKDALLEVPEGGSFADMVALKGDKEIGDKINKIIAKLAEANDLQKVIDEADFNDEEKLGKGKEMQDRLTKLVSIFANLDFRGSRAEGDNAAFAGNPRRGCRLRLGARQEEHAEHRRRRANAQRLQRQHRHHAGERRIDQERDPDRRRDEQQGAQGEAGRTRKDEAIEPVRP